MFRAGDISRSVLLDETGVCTIPWEVLVKPYITLYAGVYGARGERIVLPTVWVSLGIILEGAFPETEGCPPERAATDHGQLTGREAAEQHPMEAISGLCNALSRIPEPVEALSNEELEAILK